MTTQETIRRRKLQTLHTALVQAITTIPTDKLRAVVTALRECGATEQEFGRETWAAIHTVTEAR